MHKNMHYKKIIIDIFAVTFREEGVDWNSSDGGNSYNGLRSPSARKVWIEMFTVDLDSLGIKSPSARKVWIEIIVPYHQKKINRVTFREEGVDWNQVSVGLSLIPASHLPRGRCGLKFVDDDWDFKSKCHLPQGRCGLKFGIALHTDILLPSPSARKVWIEIVTDTV